MEISVEKQEQKNALVHRFVTRQMKLPRLIMQNISMVKEYLDDIGIKPSGAPFLVYYNMDPKNLEVAIGYPIEKEIDETEDLTCVKIPEGKAVIAIHEGSPIKLGGTYKKMTKWMNENDLEPAYLAYEYYLNSPEEVKKNELQTKVVLYLK